MKQNAANQHDYAGADYGQLVVHKGAQDKAQRAVPDAGLVGVRGGGAGGPRHTSSAQLDCSGSGHTVTSPTGRSGGRMSVTDPGVEQGVADIRYQVAHHGNDAHDDRYTEHDRVVVRQCGVVVLEPRP